MLFLSSCDGGNVELIYEENEDGLYVVAGVKGDKHSVKTVVIPEYHDTFSESTAVVGIKAEAFKECGSLTHVVISSFIKEIGEGAFENCYNLKSVLVADSGVSGDVFSVNKIGARAFKGCVRLSSIGNTYDNLTWPTRYIRYIGDEAFMNCTDLPYIHLNDDIEYIGANAFNGCSQLEYIYIGNRLNEIKEGTFEGCKSLTDINIQNGITVIENNAFKDCINLNDINIPYTVKKLENNVFEGCKALTKVTGCRNVTEVGNGCFYKCSNLKSIENTAQITSLGESAFYQSGIEEIDLSSIVNLENEVFYGCSSLRSVIFTETVKTFGDDAFQGCTNLYDLTIPNSVKKIGERCFYYCSSLVKLFIPEDCIYGEQILSGCNKMTEIIDLTNNRDYFEYLTFKYSATVENSNLVEKDDFVYYIDANEEEAYLVHYNGKDSKVVIPSKIENYPITIIKQYAFSGNPYIKEVEFNSNIYMLEKAAFYECDGLARVVIPENIKVISQNCFAECDGLRIIQMEEGVNYIFDGAFYSKNISYINIPESIVCLDSYAINLSSLNDLYITFAAGKQKVWSNYEMYLAYLDAEEAEIKEEIATHYYQSVEEILCIDGPSGSSSNLEIVDEFIFDVNSKTLVGYLGDDSKIVLPESYNDSSYNIGAYAFANNLTVYEVVISDGVKHIGDFAFAYCKNLEVIDFKNTVQTIGCYALLECEALEWILLPSSVDSIDETALVGTMGLKFVFVDKEALEVSRSGRGIDYKMYDYYYSLEILRAPYWIYNENGRPSDKLGYE